MFARTIVILFVFSTFALSEAAFVDNLKKCSVKDEECLRMSFADTFKSLGESGVPELGIIPFDPLHLEKQSVSLPNLFHFDLIDGLVTGVKNCKIEKFIINVDKGNGMNEFTCDLVIEGKYNFEASSPILKELLGEDSAHGDGNGKIEIEKLHFKLDFPLSVQRRDGDIYIQYDFNHIVYEYEILGRAKIFFDQAYIGEQESSEKFSKIFNDNWKLVVSTFGTPFVERGLKIAFSILSKFYNVVPAKYYLTDDLSSYVQ